MEKRLEYFGKVIKVVTELMDVTDQEILGKSRRMDVVDARWMVIYLMKEAGYIADVVMTTEFPKKLVITLKYSDRAVPAITELKRISKPGLRKFVSVPEIPAVLGGMGLAILSTSKGVMSGKEARAAKVGGEILCTIA